MTSPNSGTADGRHDRVSATGVARTTVWKSRYVRIVRWGCRAALSQKTAVLTDPWYVVSFTHRGSFLVETRGQTQMIDSTRAMLIRPGETFQMTRCNESVAEGSAIGLHPDLVRGLDGIDDSAARVAVPVSAFVMQHVLLRRLADMEDPETEEMAVWVAGRAMRAPGVAAKAVREKLRGAITDVQFLLAKRYREQVRLEDLAGNVNKSPYHLCRAFKRETGLPIHGYLNRLRVRASLENVVDGAMNLSDLAHALGYSSHSHFGEAFRNEFRRSPSDVRRLAALPRLSDVRDALDIHDNE